MDKTLRKKYTGNTHTLAAPLQDRAGKDLPPAPALQQSDYSNELNLLKEAAKDLLQPRPEAIANILQRAKDI